LRNRQAPVGSWHRREGVTDPELYKWYTADEVIAFFGSREEAQRLCNDQWLIFPATVVCMTEIGEAPKAVTLRTRIALLLGGRSAVPGKR
jgi:hypothetical protein